MIKVSQDSKTAFACIFTIFNKGSSRDAPQIGITTFKNASRKLKLTIFVIQLTV